MLDNTGQRDSGRAYVFDAASGALRLMLENPTQSADDHFGWSVSATPTTLLVGAPADDTRGEDTGAIYLLFASASWCAMTAASAIASGSRRFRRRS